MKTIRIDAEAEEEITHAIDHYDEEREGLGAEFWDEGERQSGHWLHQGPSAVP